MSARLPEFIDPLYLADKNASIKGQMPLNALDRLAEKLFDGTGGLAIEFFFYRDGRIPVIEGRLQATLNLKCQNCLASLAWAIDTPVKLGVVTSIEQADRLPEDYEPLMCEGDNLLLKDIVEDELLLALPIFPKHEHVCFDAGTQADKIATPEEDGQPPSRKNPFSILANLKKNTGDL